MSTAAASFPKSIRVGARWSPVVEALRYLVSSVVALALDAALLWVCVSRLDWPIWLSGAIAYASGLVLIYLLSVRWVFAARAMRSVGTEFLLFAVLGVLGLVLNSSTLAIATSCGLALPVAKAISAGIGFTTNFLTRKLILFSVARA